jgi:iron complex transport system substrate-binding protein
MRIVSLLGSATEIVYELGLEEHLVGISHECDHPPAALALPRVSRPRFDPRGLGSAEVDAEVRRCMAEYGSVYEIDRTLLEELRPTLILTQGICDVCAVPTGSVQEVVSTLPSSVEILALDSHTLEEIFATVMAVADAAGATRRGEELVSALRARLELVADRTAPATRPRVLLLEWLAPPFAPGHWVPEMVEIAGGENLLGTAGLPSRALEWSALPAGGPDVLLIEPCGYDLEQAVADAERHRQPLERVAGAAIAAGRAWVLHSAWFSRSGPRVVEGVEVLGRILHPATFPDVNPGGRARLWC